MPSLCGTGTWSLTQLAYHRFHVVTCYLLHLFSWMRPHEDLSEDNSPREIVRRVKGERFIRPEEKPEYRSRDESDVSMTTGYDGAVWTTLHILECNCNEWQTYNTSKKNTSMNFLKFMLLHEYLNYKYIFRGWWGSLLNRDQVARERGLDRGVERGL